MQRETSLSTAAYVRTIERHWSRRVEQAVVLSPRDFALLSDWHLRGVPLDLVREALDAALARQAGHSRRIGLSSVRSRVENAWAVISRGRLGTSATPSGSEARSPSSVARWRRRAEGEPPGSPLAVLLEELLERLSDGADPGAIDSQLEEGLFGAVDPILLKRVREDLGAELAPYRERMGADRLAATLSRASISRLRETLDLPDLLDDATEG